MDSTSPHSTATSNGNGFVVIHNDDPQQQDDEATNPFGSNFQPTNDDTDDGEGDEYSFPVPQNTQNGGHAHEPPTGTDDGEYNYYRTDNTVPPPSSSVICKHCNSLNPSTNQTCLKCGNTMLVASTYNSTRNLIQQPPANQAQPAAYSQPPPPPQQQANGIHHLHTNYPHSSTPGGAEHDDDDNEPPFASAPELGQRYSSQYHPAAYHGHLAAPTEGDIYRAEEQLFGNFFIRTLGISVALLLLALLSFGVWFDGNDNSISSLGSKFKAALGLCGTGLLFIFFGAVLAIVYVVVERKNAKFQYLNLVRLVVMVLYFGGAFFYFIGGCVLTAAFNGSLRDAEPKITAFSGIWFGEITFVAAHTVVAGLDIRKRYLNTHGLRMVLMSALLWCLALLLFFCCAVWSGTLAKDDRAGYGLTAFGYFVIMLVIPIFIAMKLCLSLEHGVQKKIDLVLSICLLFAVMFAVFGYWALAGQDGSTQFDVYWIGFSFFLLFHAAMIALDMRLERYLPCLERLQQNGGGGQTSTPGGDQQYMLMPDDNNV